MLERIKRFFDRHIAVAGPSAFASDASGAGSTTPTHGLHLATAALMLEVSRADFQVHDSELEAIARILQRQFEFNDQETRELLEVARAESDELLSLHPFVRLINEHFDAGGRARIIEDLWRVAYADGRLDKHQEYTVRKIADLLYVPHSVYIATKLRVAEGAGDKAQETRDR